MRTRSKTGLHQSTPASVETSGDGDTMPFPEIPVTAQPQTPTPGAVNTPPDPPEPDNGDSGEEDTSSAVVPATPTVSTGTDRHYPLRGARNPHPRYK
jgi:hypothetical protein